MSRKTKETPTEMEGNIEFQRGSSFLFYDPEVQYLRPDSRWKFKAPGRVRKLDEQGKAVLDAQGRPQFEDVTVELVGRVRLTVAGWALGVGDVPEWELLNGQKIPLTDLLEWLGE